jgi:hypothetical protein
MYVWANAPAAVPHAIAAVPHAIAAVPHAIACVAAVNVDVDVPLPPPLSRARAIRDSLSKRAATRHAISQYVQRKKRKGTYHPLQQFLCKTNRNGLPHKHDKPSCDILQLHDVAAAEGNTKVACEVPQPRIRTRENQQHQKIMR